MPAVLFFREVNQQSSYRMTPDMEIGFTWIFYCPPLITIDFLLPRKKALPLRRDEGG